MGRDEERGGTAGPPAYSRLPHPSDSELVRKIDAVSRRIEKLEHRLTNDIYSILTLLERRGEARSKLSAERRHEYAEGRLFSSDLLTSPDRRGTSPEAQIQADIMQCSINSKASSDGGVTESWEFKSCLEAPIATLESLDELDQLQTGEVTRGSESVATSVLPRQRSSDV